MNLLSPILWLPTRKYCWSSSCILPMSPYISHSDHTKKAALLFFPLPLLLYPKLFKNIQSLPWGDNVLPYCSESVCPAVFFSAQYLTMFSQNIKFWIYQSQSNVLLSMLPIKSYTMTTLPLYNTPQNPENCLPSQAQGSIPFVLNPPKNIIRKNIQEAVKIEPCSSKCGML